MKMYRFVLVNEINEEFMGTDVDEPNPMIDQYFWSEFMKGNCAMLFKHSYDEEN